MPVTGSNQWWNQALAAFKAYIETSAVDTETLATNGGGDNQA